MKFHSSFSLLVLSSWIGYSLQFSPLSICVLVCKTSFLAFCHEKMLLWSPPQAPPCLCFDVSSCMQYPDRIYLVFGIQSSVKKFCRNACPLKNTGIFWSLLIHKSALDKETYPCGVPSPCLSLYPPPLKTQGRSSWKVSVSWGKACLSKIRNQTIWQSNRKRVCVCVSVCKGGSCSIAMF